MLHPPSNPRLATLLMLAILGLAALAASHGSKAPAIGAAVTAFQNVCYLEGSFAQAKAAAGDSLSR